MIGPRQLAPQQYERRCAEGRRHDQGKQAIQQHGSGGLREVDTVEHKHSDQRALGAPDSARYRDEVAQLPDQISEDQDAEERLVAHRGKGEPEREDVECHVGK